MIVSPLCNTPPPHTSAAAHTSWAVCNSEPERSRAPVNVAISARIGPIPHNLVCTWHLALNHKSARLKQVLNLSAKQLCCPSTAEEGKSTFNYLCLPTKAAWALWTWCNGVATNSVVAAICTSSSYTDTAARLLRPLCAVADSDRYCEQSFFWNVLIPWRHRALTERKEMCNWHLRGALFCSQWKSRYGIFIHKHQASMPSNLFLICHYLFFWRSIQLPRFEQLTLWSFDETIIFSFNKAKASPSKKWIPSQRRRGKKGI